MKFKRPWRLVKLPGTYWEIQDADGDLICGVFAGQGFQGGLLDKEAAEEIIEAINSTEASE